MTKRPSIEEADFPRDLEEYDPLDQDILEYLYKHPGLIGSDRNKRIAKLAMVNNDRLRHLWAIYRTAKSIFEEEVDEQREKDLSVQLY